jgi:hypothetical protein
MCLVSSFWGGGLVIGTKWDEGCGVGDESVRGLCRCGGGCV